VACIFERNLIFRELCEDYEECLGAIARFGAQHAGSEALCKEYAALKVRLETELLRHLHEDAGLGGHSGFDKRGQ
jgi:hypothetical protein